MKKYLILPILFLCYYCSAQHLQYSYDASGNRVLRQYSAHRMANPNSLRDSSASVEKKYGINVFPNPTSNTLNVSISSLENNGVVMLYLSDEQGKIIIMKQKAAMREILELGNLKPGIYYLKVIINNDNISYKIAKI